MKLFDYDDEDEKSIYSYAIQLKGMKFRDILWEYEISPYKIYVNKKRGYHYIEEKNIKYHSNKAKKGEVGNLLEEFYFGFKPNPNQEPDFPKVGIELKQTCLDLKKNGTYSAGERLSITNISYTNPINTDFYKTHVWNKMKRILLVHYVRDKSKERLDYKIKFVTLFSPSEEDLKIIIDDYNRIVKKIIAGDAHNISEGDTLYLGACTKGMTAEKSLKPQYYGNHILAKTRNFCFKKSYMNYILNNYVLSQHMDYESIVNNNNSESCENFEGLVLSKLSQYYGISKQELIKHFNVKSGKRENASIIYRILGITGNYASEFVKANIKIKVLMIEENGRIKESMPLPSFKIKKLIKEEWDTSTLNELLSETKYLMVFFRKKGQISILQNAIFWNMPVADFEIVRKEWEMAVSIIKNGVELKRTPSGRVKNNLLSQKETQIIHIRPHSRYSAYRLNDGFTKGELSFSDELPSGERITKQSFWLNAKYLMSKFPLE